LENFVLLYAGSRGFASKSSFQLRVESDWLIVWFTLLLSLIGLKNTRKLRGQSNQLQLELPRFPALVFALCSDWLVKPSKTNHGFY